MFRLLTLTLGLVGSLFIAEVLVRGMVWAGGPSPRGSGGWAQAFEFSTLRHHRLVPGVRVQHVEPEFAYVWENNALGMRDRERSPAKPPGHARAVFLGDSFVQGYGVEREQSMVALLEDSLNRPPAAKPVEILNAGVFGYSPLLEYLYLRELMPAIQADLVVVGFFLGNDVGDDNFYAAQARTAPDGSVSFEDERWPWTALNEMVASGADPVDATAPGRRPVLARAASRAWAVARPQFQRSLLWRWGERAHRSARLRREHAEQVRERRALAWRHRDDIRYNLGAVNHPVTDPSRRLGYWATSTRYLRKIHALCAAHGVPMVLVVIPALDLLDQAATFPEPYDVLDALGRELSIPVIQMLPGFAGRPVAGLVYELDGHWTPEGNRVAAAILDREFRQRGLLSLLTATDRAEPGESCPRAGSC